MSETGVIFDMDGVLVDSYDAHFLSWKEVANQRGLEMTEENFAATFGRTSRDIIRALWGDAVSDAEIPEVDAAKEAAYRDILRRDFPAMDGATELLQSLSDAGFAMAIGSSGPPENVQCVLDELPGGNLIAASVNGQDVSKGKPDPEVFLKAAMKLGISPERCAVVEDAPAGVQAARAAGSVAIALTGTACRAKLAEQAHLVVDSLRELTPERIAEWIGRNTDG